MIFVHFSLLSSIHVEESYQFLGNVTYWIRTRWGLDCWWSVYIPRNHSGCMGTTACLREFRHVNYAPSVLSKVRRSGTTLSLHFVFSMRKGSPTASVDVAHNPAIGLGSLRWYTSPWSCNVLCAVDKPAVPQTLHKNSVRVISAQTILCTTGCIWDTKIAAPCSRHIMQYWSIFFILDHFKSVEYL